VLNEQLQTALTSRVIIEQAKGALAQRGDLSMDAAFDRLRRYARDHNLRLSEVARQVVETGLAADVLARRAPRHPHHAGVDRHAGLRQLFDIRGTEG
jgi:hypothetical protein